VKEFERANKLERQAQSLRQEADARSRLAEVSQRRQELFLKELRQPLFVLRRAAGLPEIQFDESYFRRRIDVGAATDKPKVRSGIALTGLGGDLVDTWKKREPSDSKQVDDKET